MSVTDFLFEGKPPKSVTTYGKTTKDIPRWLSDYTQGLIARANVIAAEPYQAYQGPRIAGFSPDQLQAFEATRANVGRADPFISGAQTATEQAIATSPLQQASQYITGASGTFPGAVQDYMNPYIQNVLNRQESMAERTLKERFLPSVQEAFVGSGQFGSSRMLEQAQRGARDIAENLEEQRLSTLGQAYGQAADIYGQDQARQAQLAQITGNLATAGGDLGIRGAQQLGALGEFASAQGLRDAAALEAVGAQQQGLGQRSLDLAYQDFLQQRDYPRQTIDWMASVVRGLPSPTQTTTQTTGPGTTFQPSPLSQLGSLAASLKGLQSLTGDQNKRGGHIRRYAKGGLAFAKEQLREGDFTDV